MDNILEIKKELYKTKPTAYLYDQNDDNYYYESKLTTGNIYFVVPIVDMGDHRFQNEEPAQLLIRYIAPNKLKKL